MPIHLARCSGEGCRRPVARGAGLCSECAAKAAPQGIAEEYAHRIDEEARATARSLRTWGSITDSAAWVVGIGGAVAASTIVRDTLSPTVEWPYYIIWTVGLLLVLAGTLVARLWSGAGHALEALADIRTNSRIDDGPATAPDPEEA